MSAYPFVIPPKVSIIVPAKNEARNLAEVLPLLPAVHEVILVDGNSVDGTVEAALAALPSIRVVRQTRRGKGNALVCGFEAATGDVIVMFDADGSADPDEIPAFIDAILNGADVAKGSRFAQGGSSEDITIIRSLGNLGLNFVTNVLFRSRYTDLCYGYNAFRTSVLPALELPSSELAERADGQMRWGDGFEIETVLNCRFAAAGLNIVEVPSIEKSRIHGVSNLNAITDGLRVLRTIIDEWRSMRAKAVRAKSTRAKDTQFDVPSAAQFTDAA